MKCVILAMALLLWSSCAGCRLTESAVPTSQPPKRPLVGIPQGASPRLGTNEVLRIAWETAQGRGFRMNEYHCDMLIFQPGPASSQVSGTWRLYFVSKPPAPDMEFLVMVNDSSGKAELWVP